MIESGIIRRSLLAMLALAGGVAGHAAAESALPFKVAAFYTGQREPAHYTTLLRNSILWAADDRDRTAHPSKKSN